MKISRFAFTLLPALVLSCGVATASSIMVSGVDETRGAKYIVISENNKDVQLYFAGVISIEVTEGGKTFTRDSLCVDLFTDIVVGQHYDTNLLQPSMVPGKNLTRASWLVDNYLLPVQTWNQNAIADSVHPYWVNSIAQGEGIQLAIWDIVHNDGDGFSAGSVQAARITDTTYNSLLGVTDPAALFWANFYENASAGMSNNQAFVYNNVVTGTNPPTPAQMLIGPQFFDGGPQPVPEPQTLMPMGIALIALSLGLRRGIRKHQ
jgi:hypothetical protein